MACQDKPDDSGDYFYAMWFRHKATGKIVRRPDGKPFRMKKRKGKLGDTSKAPHAPGDCSPQTGASAHGSDDVSA